MKNKMLDIAMQKRVSIKRSAIFLFCLLCIFFSNLAMGYNPPIGIPAPMWGNIDPIEMVAPPHPPEWPSNEVAGYYYFDNTNPNCTNTDNTYGYPDKPRCSFLTTWVVDAGAYIEVHGGPYTMATSSHNWYWKFNGTEVAPVWFRGASVESRPEFSENDWRIMGSYAVIENLLFTPYGSTHDFALTMGGTEEASASYMVLRHIEAAGDGMQVLGFGAVISTGGNTVQDKTNNIVFYDVKIHDFGDDDATEENDLHGILSARFSNNIWLLDSEIYNMGGDSIQVGSNNYVGEDMPHHIYIGRNNFYHNYENAVDVKNAHHVIVSQNKMHDFSPHLGYGYGNPVTLHQQSGDVPTYTWLLFNDIYDCAQGIRVQDFENVHIIGNKFWNIHATAEGDKTSCWYNTYGIAMRTSKTFGSIVDNTFYDTDVFIAFPANLKPDGVTVSGNIYASKGDTGTYDICADSTVNGLVTLDYDLYQNFEKVKYDGLHSSLASLQSRGACINCKEGDPQFVSAPSELGLKVSSPAKDMNRKNAVYDLFFSNYGIKIEVDSIGTSKWQGAGWDIGAFEIDEGNEGTVLESPFIKNINLR